MNILDLNEAQGLTPEMVHEKLIVFGRPRRSCPSFAVCPSLGPHTHHGHSDAIDFIVPDAWTERRQQVVLESAIGFLAALHGMSDQELLRDINPRMRHGLPSKEAWLAHGGEDGFWLGVWDVDPDKQLDNWKRLVGKPIVTQFFRNRDHWNWGLPGIGWSEWPGYPGGKEWSFWPCDAHGNKVPWPTKDGVML